jgi:hypothetical protein
MDFGKLVAFHREKNADVTLVMHPCAEAAARSKGIAQVHPSSGESLQRAGQSCLGWQAWLGLHCMAGRAGQGRRGIAWQA